ncbi:MAG: endolytic transglycosylase MltG [Chloroflexi bacterium]|nr:endolytic transglycosylase MltG [Chloroflexota bacterium]
MGERRGCSGFAAALVLGLISLAVLVAFFGVSSLTARAAQQFGAPAEELNTIQRAQLGVRLGLRSETLLRPVDPDASEQDFAIEFGEDTRSILARLEASGLIREAALFGDYLVYSGLDRQLQAGEFALSPAMTALELAQAMLDPNPGVALVSIFPGWRLEEITAGLQSSGLEFEPADFLAAAQDDYPQFGFLSSRPQGVSLEGYFLAGDYEFERESRAEEVVVGLLTRFESGVGPTIIAGWEAHGLTVHQALTLASIVAREAVIEEEMPLIASVFLNRYTAGIKLEADPTVQYALGYDKGSQSWWTRPLLTGHLTVDSPYNTYLYGGLPPGPIASSSLAALQAIAFPAESSFYFFQATCDSSGAHVFAVTFAEHLGNNCP